MEQQLQMQGGTLSGLSTRSWLVPTTSPLTGEYTSLAACTHEEP